MVEGRRDGLLDAGTGMLMEEMLRPRKGLCIQLSWAEGEGPRGGRATLAFLPVLLMRTSGC